MKGFFCAVVLLAAALLASGEKVRYDGYKVMRMTPQSQEDLQTLREMESIGASYWEEPSKVGRAADIMFPPHLQHLISDFQRSGMKVESFIDNVQELIDYSDKMNAQNKATRMTWNAYYEVDEIYDFLDEQAAAHPGVVSVSSIGQTTEGRDLRVLKISHSGNTKPIIWVDANIHAREWITSAVATYLINELLNGDDAEVRQWAEDFDWHFLAVTNPDGLEFTKRTDRMWRKTRSTNAGSSCKGADANRNFGFHWFEGGSSSSPCSETFAGKEAWSEVESKAIKVYLDEIASRMVFYLSLHSYSQIVLLPYGYTSDHIAQYDTYMSLAKQAVAKHAERYGTQFDYGNTVEILYQCSGITMDYAKGQHNTSLTLTYEMRDTGRYGFVLPPDQITPSALEFIDGLHVYIDALRQGIV